MPLPPSAHKDIYSALLKRVVGFLEQLYGLTSGANQPRASPPEGCSPARHFASYLALSGLTCWLYTVKDRETDGDVVLFLAKPQKPDTFSCFKAFPVKDWMKDVPDLTKLYAKANRNEAGYVRSHGLKPILWSAQVGSPSLHAAALELAGDIAAHENVSVAAPTALQEPDVTAYDLFALYGAVPAAGALPPPPSLGGSSTP